MTTSSCLLPQFKCHPDTFSLSSKLPPPTPSFPHVRNRDRERDYVYFRAQCAVSTPAPPISAAETVLLDIEKLRLSYEAKPASLLPAYDSITYSPSVHSPSKANFDATFAAKALIENEEAVIAAAASEALTLARAAAKVAKDAALMAGITQFSIPDSAFDSVSEGQPTSAQNSEFHLGNTRSSEILDTLVREGDFEQSSYSDSDGLEPTSEDLQQLQEELVESTAVKSVRSEERKAKRARSAKKVVPTGKASTRKKGTSGRSVGASDPMGFIKGRTCKGKLLTAAEEGECSSGIQDLLKLQKLRKELEEKFGCEPSLQQWADAVGVDRWTLTTRVNHGHKCKDKMIHGNVRLVISIARKYYYQGSQMQLDNLVQEGFKGLIRSTEKFDATKGFRFSTYAHWWIKQSIRRSLTNNSRTIRVPGHLVEAGYKVRQAKKKFYDEHQRLPNDEELAEATGLSMNKLQTVLRVPKEPLSLDQRQGSEDGYNPAEVIADPGAEACDVSVTKLLMRQDMEKLLDDLSPREKKVIRWRYGLEDGRTKTLQEIGELMSISRERVRQIESLGFLKLQNLPSLQATENMQQYLIA